MPHMQFRTIFFIYLILSSTLLLQAQLSCPAADTAFSSAYKVDGAVDSVFIFSVENTGREVIFSPKDNTISVDAIEWMYYSKGKYIPITGIPSLTQQIFIDTISTSIGLQARYTQNGTSDSVRCWVYIDEFSVEIGNKDESDSLMGVFDCNRIIEINARLLRTNYFYYNPLTQQPYAYIQNYDVRWERSPVAGSEPQPINSNVYKVKVDKPHWENTSYFIIVTSPLGNTQTDMAIYKSVRPLARLECEYIPVADELTPVHPNYEYYTKRNNENTAPVTYKFWSESRNSDRAHLYIFVDYDGDDIYTRGSDSLLYSTQTTGDTVYYTFRFPSEKYRAQLEAQKDVAIWSNPCVSDTSISDITVEPPALTIMNVFAIGDNNIFRFDEVSIEEMHIEIYNRYGKRVHEYDGNIRDWEGWDGRINNSSNYVQTGVYYYVVQWRNVLQDFQLYLPVGDPGADDKLIAVDINKPYAEKPTDNYEGKTWNNVYRGFVHVFNADNK